LKVTVKMIAAARSQITTRGTDAPPMSTEKKTTVVTASVTGSKVELMAFSMVVRVPPSAARIRGTEVLSHSTPASRILHAFRRI
jgi:hypothetical protein